MIAKEVTVDYLSQVGISRNSAISGVEEVPMTVSKRSEWMFAVLLALYALVFAFLIVLLTSGA